MLCGNVCLVVPNNANVVSDECNALLVLCGVSYNFLKNTFSSEVFVLSDIRPFGNLTFYIVLARQGFSKLLRSVTLNGSPRRLSRRSKVIA